MSRHRRLPAFLLFVLMATASANADTSCSPDIRNIERGTTEIVTGDVGSKIEGANAILKMKISGAFNTSEWSWVSFAKGPAQLTGWVRGKDTRGVIADTIAVKAGEGEANWAVFKSNDPFAIPNTGRAYFMINSKLTCVDTTLVEWNTKTVKVFGESFAERRSVEAAPAAEAYSAFGLK